MIRERRYAVGAAAVNQITASATDLLDEPPPSATLSDEEKATLAAFRRFIDLGYLSIRPFRVPLRISNWRLNRVEDRQAASEVPEAAATQNAP